MPLELVRSASNDALWTACCSRFLNELGERGGPAGFPSHLWLVHRTQRDRLLAAAEPRGSPGWLSPPFSFLSELRDRFGIRERPLGILTGRLLVSRLAAEFAARHGFTGAGREAGPGRGHMLDRVLSELLPEGVTADELEGALAAMPVDSFGSRRTAWLVDTYRAFLERVEERGQYDPRSIHAMVAARIRDGALPAALGGAGALHVYGLTSLRGRRRLFQALRAQGEVLVTVYLPTEPDESEWDELAGEPAEMLAPAARGRGRESGGEDADAAVHVQPAPDAVREAAWVAREIKQLIASGRAAPDEIAVVARSGREDTRRVHEALKRSGVPSTARLRSPLAEIPALRALLQLLRAEAEGWTYTALRPVLASPYFDVRIDLRGVDHLATLRQPAGLGEWLEGLARLRDQSESDDGWILRREGLRAVRLTRDVERLEAFAASVAPLTEERDEAGWIDVTRSLLTGEPLDLRRRSCRAIAGRWDIVRWDQRGTLALESLLAEWKGMVRSRKAFGVAEWHSRLRRLLEANELALSTPLQRGVQVLEAHEAALAPFAHTFIVHANDGVFPPARAGGGVFTDEERRELNELGIPIATRDRTIERERRLFLAVAGGPRVTISYRTTDANGIPRLPSLMVPTHDPATELPRTLEGLPNVSEEPHPVAAEVRGADGGAEPLPPPRLPAVSESEQLQRDTLRLVRRRRASDPSPIVTPDPFKLRHAILSAFAEELRRGNLDPYLSSERDLLPSALRSLPASGGESPITPDSEAAAALFGNQRPLSERPTAWNGKLRDPFVLAELAARFGDEREWSASQLETYGRRPFDFLLERVLGLSESEEAEEEASPLTVGGLVHEILDRFYSSFEGAPPETFDEAGTAFSQAFEGACDEYERDVDRWVGAPHVWEASRDELRERIAAFLAWEFRHRERGTPVAVELAFGRRADRLAIDLSGPDKTGVVRPLKLAGRIDRIDRIGDPRTGPLRIIDYKSGSSAPPAAAFADGAALQAPLYMAAAERLGVGTPAVGVYRTVKRPGDRSKRTAGDVEAALRIARSIPPRVRAGLFEAVQARSMEVRDWQPGRDVTRSQAQVSGGTRFDPVHAPAVES